jgi:hypothetical protein
MKGNGFIVVIDLRVHTHAAIFPLPKSLRGVEEGEMSEAIEDWLRAQGYKDCDWGHVESVEFKDLE